MPIAAFVLECKRTIWVVICQLQTARLPEVTPNQTMGRIRPCHSAHENGKLERGISGGEPSKTHKLVLQVPEKQLAKLVGKQVPAAYRFLLVTHAYHGNYGEQPALDLFVA